MTIPEGRGKIIPLQACGRVGCWCRHCAVLSRGPRDLGCFPAACCSSWEGSSLALPNKCCVSVCVQPAWPCSCGCVLLVVMQEYVKPLLFEGGFGSDEVTEKPHEPSTRLSTSGALLVVVDVASSGNSPELQVEGVRWQVSQSPSLCSHPAHVQVASEALQRGDSTASGLRHPRGDLPHWRG